MSTPRDPEQDLKRLLDDDGGEFGAIYRRLSRPEPPRRLDRVVIAHAARAVRGERAPPAQRWLLGLGSAAGIVLAAGIAWQVGRQMDSHDAQRGPERSQRSVIPVEPISESSRLEKSVSPEAAATVADEETSAQAAPAKQESTPPARKKLPSRSMPMAAPPPPPAAAPRPPVEARAMEVAPAPIITAADEAQAFPEAKDSATHEGVSADTSKRQRSQADAQASGNAAAMSAPKAIVEQSRVPSPSSSIKLRQNMHLAPQDWLAEIVRLKREGRNQEAIENLRLFRRMHPDWKLSDELRRLAK